ncbi:hypothetical protein ACFQ3J_08400 [Paenibacillus provencensis]|uniref:Photosynthesis system II assembly factor Ycf48/Hcf136-like domain-containing protein n=1 Tax=Paenibacillus provencensis TaxID=441151 RepID=A0ABW3Q1T8_9BACL|nr:hypothetical protein [Paenibacillus sp. MER 78]MCM3129088.1 hypothetical protein [Paenibacillus sp. MER 78]
MGRTNGRLAPFARITKLTLTLALTGSMAVMGTVSAEDTSALTGNKPAGGEDFYISDIQFLNGTTGRAAGNGYMIGTSDAGDHWQNIYTGTWQFTQLDFINNREGYALAKSVSGGPNALLYTDDGGKSLLKIRTGSMYLQRIDFREKDQGFGFSRAYTYYTSDGGSSWSKIATPTNTRYAVFSDPKKGYALTVHPGYGYKLHQTTNGGKDWDVRLSVASESVSGGEIAVNGQEVWVRLNGGAGMSQQSYALYASRNAGQSFYKVISQDTAGAGPAPGNSAGYIDVGPAAPAGHPGNLSLVNGAAYLAGFSPAGEKIGVGSSFDGGKTWTNQPSIEGYGSVISFTNIKSGWMADTSLTHPAIYRTIDGGQHWTEVLVLEQPND